MSKRSDEILVLDDEAGFAEMLCSTLQEEGFASHMLTSPSEAVEWLGKHSCSLILADYCMPQLNGAEFLQQVRENHPRLPVIMISGQMNTRDLLNVANMGVSLVLEKPVERKTLIESVSRFVDPKETHIAQPAHATAQTQSGPTKAVRIAPATPYPSENVRCAQTSEESKFFLQSLWDAVREHNGATLALPLGGELELIVSDIEHWFNLEPPALRLSPAMMQVDSKSLEDSKALIILDARYALSDLNDAIVKLRQSLPKGLPLLVLMRSDNAKPHGNLPLVALPALSRRLCDIAEYSKAILERVAATGALTPDAARLLLNYPWPGNYYELMGALRRAVLSDDTARIDAKALSTAIASGHGAASAAAENMTMENHLAAAQAHWFDTKLCTDIPQAAEIAGLPKSAFNPDIPLSKQKLLIPEVMAVQH